jgi:membrane associated rhomboid family serine protease
MFPIGDDNTGRHSLPIVTYVLIAINVLVFLLELQGGEEFIRRWAFVPVEFRDNPSGEAVTALTAMFLHGGWMHLFGNMLYLWILGDNVEDRFGKVWYLIFYLASGFAATAAQYMVQPNGNIPNVGASGAIAGVLGAYILLFPRALVRVAIGYSVVALPAIVVLGFWIALQLFSGVGSIATTDETASTGGVAYMAHVGGFVAGLALAFLLRGTLRGPTREA